MSRVSSVGAWRCLTAFESAGLPFPDRRPLSQFGRSPLGGA
ncbi:MAG: hypothetical protein EAZ42_04910 [Verrucomicrobia bacterium]|nr:MAG: hypothetical protein EAZ42_04910 [Verrucomicrobiota bacterium]